MPLLSWKLISVTSTNYVDTVDSYTLTVLLELSFQRVLDIIQTGNQPNIQVMRYASKLMRLCVQKFNVARMACVLHEEAICILQQFLPTWCKLAVQWLDGNTNISDIHSRLAVILEFLRFLTCALEAFSDECGAIFSDSMRSAWSILCLVRDHNQRRAIVSNMNGIGEFKKKSCEVTVTKNEYMAGADGSPISVDIPLNSRKMTETL